jgi:hypothetical protein
MAIAVMAVAVHVPAMAQNARPDLAIDMSRLPAMPPPLKMDVDNEARLGRLIGQSFGAVAGIALVEIASGGLLLAPLGFSLIAGAEAAAVPAAAPAAATAVVNVGYSLSAKALSVIAVAASAVAGAYAGGKVAPAISSLWK